MSSASTRKDEWSASWRPIHAVEIEFFKARFVRHSYVRHTHDAYAIGVIEDGVQTFRHGGEQRITPTMGIVVVNPDEAHDGRSFCKTGYRYRMMYVPPDFFHNVINEVWPRQRGQAYFSAPVLQDRELASRYLCMHRLADESAKDFCPTELQSRLHKFLIDLTQRHAEPCLDTPASPMDRARVTRAIEFMHANLGRKITLEELAAEVGLSRYHFLRQFREVVGLPPHAFLCQLRLESAKRRIRRGEPLARAAIEAGFFDQSHFTNRFRATYGVTPAEYGRNCN